MRALSAEQGRQRIRRLALLGSPLAAALLYERGLPLPRWQCPFRCLTGIPCPTCGMTRSFVALAGGRWSQAVSEHAFGPVLAGILLAVGACWALELALGRRIQFASQRLIRPVIGLGLGLYLGYYGIRLRHLAESGQLWRDLLQSPLGQWLT